MVDPIQKFNFLRNVLKYVVCEQDYQKRLWNAQSEFFIFLNGRSEELMKKRGYVKIRNKLYDICTADGVYDRKIKWRKLIYYMGFDEQEYDDMDLRDSE